MIRWHVVLAVFARNVKQYFSGPLGYLFIVVFVTVCSVMTFSPQFFADNLANLDQLSNKLPLMLLFFIPAITMSAWAEEKRQGTDSILFTLPASDFDILLGKYLAVVAVYTIALLFSLFQLFNLALIGDPDWGVIAATYVGYWFAGLALLAIGMFASSLTRSSTIAFVLGALFCAVPVLIGQYFHGVVGIERLGVDWNLRDFTVGMIPLSSVFYFLALTVFMLYLNLIVISRRHWSRGEHFTHAPHYIVRVLSMLVGLGSLGYLCNTSAANQWTRADLTSERVYSLDPVTLETLEKVKESNLKVTMQAFVSSDVPRKYVNTKNQLISLLRQYNQQGGNNIDVRIVEVHPNSEQAAEARAAGIEPRFDRSDVAGRTIEQDVYMGVQISTPLDEVLLPIIDAESAIEYQLSRSVAFTVDKSQQLTIGIVDTDTFFGGPLFEGRRVPWSYETTLVELKKQFKFRYYSQTEFASLLSKESENNTTESITAENSAEGNSEAGKQDSEQKKKDKENKLPDVMLVADPSSLDDGAMEGLVRYIEAGNPTIILADPLPFRWTYQHPTEIGVLNAPRQPRLSPRSPYQQVLASSQMPKADGGTAARLLAALGVDWDNGAAAWSLDNPHPNFKGEWPPYVDDELRKYYGPREKAFVFARNRASHVAFNPDNQVSRGLNELFFMYPGSIRKSKDSQLEFQPLVSLGKDSGSTPWERLTMVPKQSTPMLNRRTGEMTVQETAASSRITFEDLVVIDPQPQSSLDAEDHVVAAWITGRPTKKSPTEASASEPSDDKQESDRPINVIFIADLDFVCEVAYQQAEALGSKFDNLALLTNSIEVLAGNTAFVNLRNRRVRPRTLARLEEMFDAFRKERAQQQQTAEEAMTVELESEQKRLDSATEEIQSDQSLSFIQRLQRTSQEATDAQRRFDMRKRKLESELNKTIDRLEMAEQKAIRGVENRTRYLAWLSAPIPALALGIFVLGSRYYNEQKHNNPLRRAN
jgi:ABC-2 type transport system permease protein